MYKNSVKILGEKGVDFLVKKPPLFAQFEYLKSETAGGMGPEPFIGIFSLFFFDKFQIDNLIIRPTSIFCVMFINKAFIWPF